MTETTTPRPLTEHEAEALMYAASLAIALPIPEQARAGVIDNIVRSSEAAAFLMGFALADHDEAAPVFSA